MLSIVAVGDIMMWPRQIEAARTGGGYSFDYVFDDVREHLKADLVIGNLETVFAGPPYLTRSGNGWRPPSFSCPDELAPALKRAGFNVLVTANNHIMDRGMKGMRRTLDVLDTAGIKHTGTYRTEADAYAESDYPLLMNVRGTRIGIAAGTYGTNLCKLPARPRWAVDLLADVPFKLNVLRPDVDVLIAYLHVGTEFSPTSGPLQRRWFKRCFDAGADIVLGSHPHVLQPVETVGGKIAAYSLGNFVSKKMNGVPGTMRSGILRIKDGKAELIPTWTGQKRFIVRLGSPKPDRPQRRLGVPRTSPHQDVHATPQG